ncbi:class III cytochrome C domain protein [Geomonas silvestris]|uniref:Class III cytochrome C domain protein n=1 Tax=Geomonas silvestris TaxID=2740184 RepID=A0A6V8MFZ1_9BACT|nr:cytochrome c3 family protein [Geomonas silvestris]GFO58877.1 class III cytochrome C domain protein [Geomonas silvestris]
MRPRDDAAETNKGRARGPLWPTLAALAVILLAFVAVLVLFNLPYPAGLGPRQPIPFSHRVHAHTKRISCLMCHTEVARSSRAGIPPLETCLLCHQRIIRTFPYIEKLRQYFRENRPVVWQRVNWVPEFVYFTHSMHIRRGIDCSICHGDVERMDRVVTAHKFEMGFCIGCHKRNKATHDCFTCHR